ncbi:efflux RND transporter periplasmic adaptor subunit [Mucilaginibacter sp. BJC16-A38]|uniref:efflux RND transporter periplasmic adaptor subunit n=1 Tax=Mucilaginibacter phenanthrenivorans TaxID=1234842 RepID=UPI0021579492|nr:efflux RND transporter periplasmic adaptor subunit [Mucilaginibacter phenanthrenivorans]MCR8561068.1 efflux RND transporter periplasmic adaptor subunit [Mucilaginibacter phenanthrenivorans]
MIVTNLLEIFKKSSLYIIVLICYSCSENPDSEIKNSNGKFTTQPTFVQTIKAKKKIFNYTVRSSGKIKAYKQQDVLAEQSGVITTCLLANGNSIRKGILLIQLDTKLINLKIQKIKELIFNNQLNFQSDLLSQESLLKNERASIRDTVNRKLRANSGLTTAEFDLKDLEIELERSTVRAPFDGKIANVKVQKDMVIKAGDMLFTLFTNNDLFLEAKILESDINNIHVGQEADIIPVSGQKNCKARVDEINPLVDEFGMVTVKLKLLTNQGLIPGMNATASIEIPNQQAIVLPKNAVVVRNNKSVVFSDVKNLAKWNYVILGRDNGNEVEILSGINPGDKVIISNNLQLAHDAPVKEF